MMLSIFSQFIFGSSSLFGGQHGTYGSTSWKDKSLCFDLRQSDLRLEYGEQLIACFFPIEDVKGNQDELGILKVTNLRLIWICCEKKRVNFSIGWRTVSLTFEQNLKDPLGAVITSLCVLTEFESTKYEFVFNKMPAFSETWNNQDSWQALIQLRRALNNDKTFTVSHLTPMYLIDPFEVVFKVWKSYRSTLLFRSCRANLNHLLPSERSSLADKANNKSLKLGEINKLPGEEILDVYTEIIHIESRSLKYTGTLILTNIRVIWIDDSIFIRNLSIPYTRIDTVRSKQPDKILINTHDFLATTNHIELRTSKKAQPKLFKTILDQIQNFFTLYNAKPHLGPESCEDCINFMNYLRPIEQYFESLDGNLVQKSQNPDTQIRDIYPFDVLDANQNVDKTVIKDKGSESNIEIAETELTRYSVKLNGYLNEQPLDRNKELIYSTELGLAVERPSNGVDIKRLWFIDL